jgi:hypothetical protein
MTMEESTQADMYDLLLHTQTGAKKNSIVLALGYVLIKTH